MLKGTNVRRVDWVPRAFTLCHAHESERPFTPPAPVLVRAAWFVDQVRIAHGDLAEVRAVTVIPCWMRQQCGRLDEVSVIHVVGADGSHVVIVDWSHALETRWCVLTPDWAPDADADHASTARVTRDQVLSFVEGCGAF